MVISDPRHTECSNLKTIFPKHILNQENHVPYRPSPQLLYRNSCTLSHDIRLHISCKNEPKNAQHLHYAPCLAC